ncbi:tRNA pseudouridine(38-40) synthase TruA [Reichenbachiella versicolor]|uniref:tRNA pseudouridine(38-40) synthase TruA n=1 Tax=Reichenbachiella versicolor TaxID=1821036 RepID=UPI000D6E3E29|nr:tRNA pseudouridine(38-40) synthase TruA [Reichenbachiella versicolor]
MRYFLELAYHGGIYHGWQVQPNAITIQQVLNEALSTILRSEIETIGSGRTDTGVHATKQIAHFDHDQQLPENLIGKLNSLLPKGIAIYSCKPVKEDASARFEASSRSYIYKMNKQKDPFSDGLSYFYRISLDLKAMNDCCTVIKKWTDFESFSKVHTDVHTFNCKIIDARWEEDNEGYRFYVSANRFLRGMVRALVGTMILAGERKISVDDFQKILEAKDRKKAGRSVPAHGLYLSAVEYPEEIYL